MQSAASAWHRFQQRGVESALWAGGGTTAECSHANHIQRAALCASRRVGAALLLGRQEEMFDGEPIGVEIPNVCPAAEGRSSALTAHHLPVPPCLESPPSRRINPLKHCKDWEEQQIAAMLLSHEF